MQASYRAIEALLLAVLSETCGRVEIYEHRILLGTVQTDMCVPQFVNDRHGISLSLEDPAKRWLAHFRSLVDTEITAAARVKCSTIHVMHHAYLVHG